MMLADDGTVLEETHYYPFGLTQRGISTRQTGNLHNKEKTFQDQQIDEDLDLNWVQFKYRNHDPQIGRFIEVDPLSEDYVHNSTYAFSENKVTAHLELEGLESIRFQDVWNNKSNLVDYIASGDIFVEATNYFNTELNPLVKATEFVTGKSFSSDFSEQKPRITTATEGVMLFLTPEFKIGAGGVLKMGAVAMEKSLVQGEVKKISLDNNALIAAVEGGGKEAVVNAIGSKQPIISYTAAKEFLAKGNKGELKAFMSEIGATVSKNGASASQVKGLQKAAEGVGRKLGQNDASIIGGAINNGASILTNDKRMMNFMQTFGIPGLKY
ncbi:RHS repeat domain-containing protein [Niabella aquatica]